MTMILNDEWLSGAVITLAAVLCGMLFGIVLMWWLDRPQSEGGGEPPERPDPVPDYPPQEWMEMK